MPPTPPTMSQTIHISHLHTFCYIPVQECVKKKTDFLSFSFDLFGKKMCKHAHIIHTVYAHTQLLSSLKTLHQKKRTEKDNKKLFLSAQ